MKILVLNAVESATLGSSYARAFRALGHEVEQFDPADVLKTDALYRNRYTRRLLERQILAVRTKEILDRLLSFEADMVWVGKGQWALPRLWHAFKAVRPKTILVCYNSDDPVTTYSRGSNVPWVTESIGCYDLFCTYKSDILEPLKAKGAKNVAAIPLAWDADILPRADTTVIEHDLLFLATGDALRQKIMIDILSDPRTENWKIGIFGHWRRSGHARLDALTKPMPYAQDEIPQAMANAVVSLNILRKQNLTSHNLRSFEIPGAGGLGLSQFSEQLGAVFPRDEAALYFDTPKEAVDQVIRMKEHPELRQRMIQNAAAICRDHTFQHRASDLLAAVASLGDGATRSTKPI